MDSDDVEVVNFEDRLNYLEANVSLLFEDTEALRKRNQILLVGVIGAAMIGVGAMRLSMMLGKVTAQHAQYLAGNNASANNTPFDSSIESTQHNKTKRESYSPTKGDDKDSGHFVDQSEGSIGPIVPGVGYDPGPQSIPDNLKEQLKIDGDVPDFHGGEEL